jgi:hypothetical protein
MRNLNWSCSTQGANYRNILNLDHTDKRKSQHGRSVRENIMLKWTFKTGQRMVKIFRYTEMMGNLLTSRVEIGFGIRTSWRWWVLTRNQKRSQQGKNVRWKWGSVSSALNVCSTDCDKKLQFSAPLPNYNKHIRFKILKINITIHKCMPISVGNIYIYYCTALTLMHQVVYLLYFEFYVPQLRIVRRGIK